MPKSAVFPYGITLREGGAVSVFPVVEVLFPADGIQKERVSLLFVVDSGATISAMPKSDADVFGIELGEGSLVTVGGIGGELIRGRQRSVMVRIADNTLLIPMVFLDDDAAPRILGREGVFDHFTIVFDEHRQRSGFLREGTDEERKVKEVLDRLETKANLTDL